MTRYSRIRNVAAALTLFSVAGGAFAQTQSGPIAGDGTFGELLDTPQDITFNVHAAGLVQGGPAPVYLERGVEDINSPPSLQVEVVGDACIRVQWGEDNPDSIEFSLQYSLIAGDGATAPAPGTITFQRGNGQLADVTDTVNGCGDPRNSPPVTTDLTVNFDAGSAQYLIPILVANGPVNDADGLDTLRLSNEACWLQPQNGTVTRSQDGTGIIYVPDNASPVGTESFEYCVTDNPLDISTGVRGRVSVTINPVSGPVEIVDDTATTGQLERVLIDVLANDTIPDGAQVVSVTRPDRDGFSRVLDQSLCAEVFPNITTNCVEYNPPSSDPQGNPYSGDETFTYSVGTSDVVIGTGNVTVTVPDSEPPPSFVDDTATTRGQETVIIDVLANDTLPDIGFIIEVSAPTQGGFVNILTQQECALTITGITTECVSYTPPSSDPQGNPFVGDDTFTYTFGGTDSGGGSANVTVTVEPAAVIVLADDTATTTDGVPIFIDVRANDTVAAGEFFEGVSATSSGGSVRIASAEECQSAFPGTTESCISYTPPESPFSGQDSFTYTISNEATSSTANVTVTIGSPQPAERSLVADTAITDINVPVVIDILGNDTIVEGDAITSVSATAAGGAVEILTVEACLAVDDDFFQPCVRYTPPLPDANGVQFIGDDTFSYTVGNGQSSATQTVTVAVAAPPGTPEAIDDDRADVPQDESVVIDVLANDTDDGGITGLTIVSVTEPANGVAAISRETGVPDTIVYSPNTGFVGEDSFFYTISDGDETTPDRTARVTVTVVSANGRVALSSIAVTPEEREVAVAIDDVCANLNTLEELTAGQQNLRTRCNALIDFASDADQNNDDAVRDALRQIAGEEVFAQSTISTQILNTQTRNIDSRLAALRGGATGVNLQGLSVGVQGKTLPGGLLASMRQPAAGASADDAPNALLEDSRLGMFVNGRVNFGDQGPTATENGFDFETLGITAGIDYRFRNDFALGFSLGYANADVDYNNTSGALDADSLSYAVYATYFTDKVYVDVLAGMGGIDFDSFRTLNFADAIGGVDTVAVGVTSGDQAIVSANFGINLQRNSWLFVPFLGYDYVSTDIDSYGETRGGGWELAFDAQDVKSQVISAGFRMSYTKSTGFGVFVPHLRLASQHELETDQRVLTARFVNDPTNQRFRFFTDAPDSSFLQLATGFSMVFENGLSAYADYESLQGYNNLKSETFTAGLRFERRFR